MKHSHGIRSVANIIWIWLCLSEDTLRVVAIMAMTVLVFISILLRLVLSWASPAWDEIARYIMIWSIMAGAIVTSRQDEHIKMGFLRSFLHTEKQLLIHNFIVTLGTLVFLCFFSVWSYQYLIFSMERGLRSIVTNIPMAPVHASFLIGIALSVFHFILHAVRKSQYLFNFLKRGT